MRSLFVIFALLVSACSSARQLYLKPSYQTHERTSLIRVEVWVHPYLAELSRSGPLLDGRVFDMWALMAQRYLNDSRDFLAVTRHTVQPAAEGVMLPQCAEGVAGRVVISGIADRDGGDVTVSLQARLETCPRGESQPELIWSAQVDHCSESADEVLKALRAKYQERFGEVAGSYAAPSFHAIRELLLLSPKPKITRDEDVMEKIELAD